MGLRTVTRNRQDKGREERGMGAAADDDSQARQTNGEILSQLWR